MKYWQRRLHLILWLLITPILILAFWFAAHLLTLDTPPTNPQQIEFLNGIETDLQKSP